MSEAIAELNDNSFDARRPDQKLLIVNECYWQGKHLQRIVVRDNGCGMTMEQLTEAMMVAMSLKREGELGEWGFGLKAACMCLGRIFTVKTSTGGNLYSVKFDEAEWTGQHERGEHEQELEFTTENRNDGGWYGTVVEICDFRREIKKKQIKRVVTDLAERFQHIIREGLVKITVKEISDRVGQKTEKLDECKPVPLKYDSEERFSFEAMDGQVTGFIAILEKPLGNGKWGFSTFKNNRLIESHSKIGLGSASVDTSDKFIYGQIHMNSVPVTSDKREWIKHSTRYHVVERKIIQIARPFKAKAKIYEKSLLDKKKYKTVPTNRVQRLLTQALECLKEVVFNVDEDEFKGSVMKKSPLGNVRGSIKVEKRKKTGQVSTTQTSDRQKPSGSRKRVPKKSRSEDNFVIQTDNAEHSFDIFQVPNGRYNPWKRWEKKSETGGYVLFVNIANYLFTSVRTVPERDRLMFTVISEAIAEIHTHNRGVAEVRDKMITEFLGAFGD